MNVENKKVSVLEQVRDEMSETFYREEEELTMKSSYDCGWDAAIDLLPVAFGKFINEECLEGETPQTYCIIEWLNDDDDREFTVTELYTYWKNEVLKKEDLVL